MRAFLAIELDDAVRQQILAFQRRLRETGADVRWVSPRNLHLTLKFFGEIEQGQVSLILQALPRVVDRHAQFVLAIAGSGAFPRGQNARVLWVGTRQGKEPLRRLQSEIEGALSGTGFPGEDKPFSPHITLGRVRTPKLLSGVQAVLETDADIELGSTLVRKLTLFESQLKTEGAEHTSLGEIALPPPPTGQPADREVAEVSPSQPVVNDPS